MVEILRTFYSCSLQGFRRGLPHLICSCLSCTMKCENANSITRLFLGILHVARFACFDQASADPYATGVSHWLGGRAVRKRASESLWLSLPTHAIHQCTISGWYTDVGLVIQIPVITRNVSSDVPSMDIYVDLSCPEVRRLRSTVTTELLALPPLSPIINGTLLTWPPHSTRHTGNMLLSMLIQH